MEHRTLETSNQKRLPVGLAPMEGVTEFPARIWFHLCSSPDFFWTPFLRVTDSFPGNSLPPLFCPELDDGATIRLIPQLMAKNAEDFCRAAEVVLKKMAKLPTSKNPLGTLQHSVDLNCGCPSPVVVGGRAGSALLEVPSILRDLAETAIRRLGADSLSIKLRTGFHCADEFPQILDALSGLNVASVAVHGRTRRDRYLGKSRLDLIQLAAARLAPVSVTGSGDITDVNSYGAARTAAPEVRRWIIGRGALRNPWIFSELRSGAPVEIDLETLVTAIQVFAGLHELYWNDGEKLTELWREGLFIATAGTSYDAWQSIARKLTNAGAVPGRRALARTKMLWNYLRSSLPTAMRDGMVLRSSDISLMIAAIRDLAMTVGIGDFVLVYDPSWDWVYSGAGKPDIV